MDTVVADKALTSYAGIREAIIVVKMEVKQQ